MQLTKTLACLRLADLARRNLKGIDGTKTLLIMQLTAIFLFVAVFQVSATGIAQTITYTARSEPLTKVFSAIKEQTGYAIIYRKEDLKGSKSVTITLRNADIKTAIEAVLKDQPLKYEMEGNTIVIGKPAGRDLNSRLEGEGFSPRLTPPPITVRGRIANEKGEPVVASVTLKGTQQGTRTDDYGNFELIKADNNGTLVISGVTIETQEVKINNRTEINIQVITKIASEEEVVINGGYYTTTQKLKTGNIAKVTAEEIEKQPVTNPLLSLQGRMAGVDITPYTGAPGGALKIQIRGQNSLRADGGFPLYVIDGVQIDSRPLKSSSSSMLTNGFDPLSTIDPANIESIEVLKDADATSIYGSRGANGVIVIKTKRKKKQEKSVIDLGYYTGIGKMVNRLNLLNSQEYLIMRNEAYRNEGIIPSGNTADDLLLWDTTRYTDWQDALLGGTANISDLHGTISAGNDKTMVSLSGGYHKENTIYPGDFGFDRISALMTANHSSVDNKLNVSLTANFGTTRSKQFNDTYYVLAALTLAPVAPKLYAENNILNWEPRPNGINSWQNPLSSLLKTHDANTRNLNTNALLSYELIPGLIFKASIGYSDLRENEIIKNPIASRAPVTINPFTKGTAIFATNSRQSWIVEPQLTYNKNIGFHKLSLVSGMTFQGSTYEFSSITGTGYNSDELLGSIMGAQDKYYSENNGAYRYQAAFIRAGYNFKDKYLLNLTGRRDGSSRFGPGKRFGNFGAIGAGWIFSEEKLFDGQQFLSYGKIRGSYGSTGNDQIGDYQYLNSYSLNYYSYQNVIGLNPSALFNPDYAWEVTRKLEVGVELGFLKDKLNIEASWYGNRSSNQVVFAPLPYITGFNSIFSNFDALVENSGLELVAGANLINTSALKWKASLNVSLPKNKLIRLDNIEESNYNTSYKVGEPLSIQRLYQFKQVNRETGEYEIIDQNNDNSIDDNDKVFSNALRRQYYGGLLNSFRLKNFEFSFLFQFSKNNAVSPLSSMGIPGVPFNQTNEVLNRWQKPGQETNVAKFATTNSSANFYFSTYVRQSNLFIVDGSFIRLKTLSLAYAIPKSLTAKIKVEQAKIYLQAQNLFTLSNYPGLDPETGNGLSPLKMINFGVNINF